MSKAGTKGSKGKIDTGSWEPDVVMHVCALLSLTIDRVREIVPYEWEQSMGRVIRFRDHLREGLAEHERGRA